MENCTQILKKITIWVVKRVQICYWISPRYKIIKKQYIRHYFIKISFIDKDPLYKDTHTWLRRMREKDRYILYASCRFRFLQNFIFHAAIRIIEKGISKIHPPCTFHSARCRFTRYETTMYRRKYSGPPCVHGTRCRSVDTKEKKRTYRNRSCVRSVNAIRLWRRKSWKRGCVFPSRSLAPDRCSRSSPEHAGKLVTQC